jgi:Matrixin
MMWLTASVIDSNENVTKYIYVGIVFTVLSILAVAYLATIFFSGSFISLDRLWPPFIDDINDEKEFEGYSGREVILVCCSWGEELADGELTYFIGDYIIDPGEKNSKHKADRSAAEAVTKAFEEWDSKLEGFAFTQTPTRSGADVEVYFQKGQNEKAGITKNYYDYYGFITKSYVLISKSAFGFAFPGNELEQIVKHEIGHVLGLGHANFDGNLMVAQVNRGSGSVSGCEAMGVYSANDWWFRTLSGNQSLNIREPTTDHVECR